MGELPTSILDFTSADRRKDGFWVTKLAYYMLWFEFLAVSPSYELARRFRAGTLRDSDKDKLPDDFDAVLSVYDDLGNVQRVLFPIWWRKVGLIRFGFEGEPPQVRRIAYLPHTKSKRPELTDRVEQFIDGAWTAQGRQRSVVIAIPVGLPKGRITRQVNAILDKVPDDQKNLIEPKAQYPLLGQRHHKDTLFRYLGALWMRSAMRSQSLWRIGARAKLSDTYSPVLDYSGPRARGEDGYDREMMAILTSRALRRGRMIAENAARGRFPVYERNENAVEIDYSYLYKLIAGRKRWKREEIKRIKRHEHGL
ncbi:hypothetical protein [Salibaculum griseiflavum]|uniref:Uncharacterized protein n=1 Tax=Salibaculum griseiflavum TaxID=1914409 RepID=A0A2V1NZ99_9RHOB|nr:hypothetical protein [Salibaculum griseiflavum]PWG15641.1 hypothetical protein DFK10_15865 [Salibaculum griseiflavum]